MVVFTEAHALDIRHLNKNAQHLLSLKLPPVSCSVRATSETVDCAVLRACSLGLCLPVCVYSMC